MVWSQMSSRAINWEMDSQRGLQLTTRWTYERSSTAKTCNSNEPRTNSSSLTICVNSTRCVRWKAITLVCRPARGTIRRSASLTTLPISGCPSLATFLQRLTRTRSVGGLITFLRKMTHSIHTWWPRRQQRETRRLNRAHWNSILNLAFVLHLST